MSPMEEVHSEMGKEGSEMVNGGNGEVGGDSKGVGDGVDMEIGKNGESVPDLNEIHDGKDDEKNGDDVEHGKVSEDGENGNGIHNDMEKNDDDVIKNGDNVIKNDDNNTVTKNDDNNTVNNDIITTPPTKPTRKSPADPSIPRYGKRYRFSYRYVRNQVFEAENETYYPPDHIKDGLLWSIRTELLTQEKQVLQSRQAIAAPFIPLYENLTNYLGTENELDRYVSQKERDRLQKLKGDALTRYRKQLTSRMVELKRRDDRKLKRFRNSLLAKTTKMGPEGVCEGCSFGEFRFHYPLVQSNKTVIRKFEGNKEVFSIYTNDHCPLSARNQL